MNRSKSKKVIVIGHARHGKDTLCEYLRGKYNITFQSSSLVSAIHVVFPILRDKYAYKDINECFNDRVNHREEWYQLIKDFNTPDKTKLADIIFASNDIYCGIRNYEELDAILEKYDILILWVAASLRKPLEADSSFNIPINKYYSHPKVSMQILLNNSTKEKFYEYIERKQIPRLIKDHLSK